MCRRRSKLGQARQRRVDRGQVRGEVVEPARGAGDRAAAVGGGEPVEVGHERVGRSAGVASRIRWAKLCRSRLVAFTGCSASTPRWNITCRAVCAALL